MKNFYSIQEIINAREFKGGVILYVIAVLAIFICFDASIIRKIIATAIISLLFLAAVIVYKKENGYFPWDKKAP